ncbi:MAG: hypothetical protein ABIO88_00535, partial [Burkholderiaceae bacterium]
VVSAVRTGRGSRHGASLVLLLITLTTKQLTCQFMVHCNMVDAPENNTRQHPQVGMHLIAATYLVATGG